MDTTFPDIIGQESAKRVLDFHIGGFKSTKVMPHLMFVAPKGCGKTTLAKAVARTLKGIDDAKRYFEINCSTIKNVKQFFNQRRLKVFVIKQAFAEWVTPKHGRATEL